MNSTGFHFPEKYRDRKFPFADNGGCFIIPLEYDDPEVKYYQCIASDGFGWRHVSVTLLNKHQKFSNVLPTWDDMCFLKNIFWDETECVVQYHPAKSDYVNNHPFCLHLWQPTGQPFPIPPSIMVGV